MGVFGPERGRDARPHGRKVAALLDSATSVLGDALPFLGGKTFDVYLNEDALWRNVPAAVWGYRLGGYQVLKKWLSYRERKVLG